MGSELGGSDPGWSQTRVGKVFAQLAEGEGAGEYDNPVFLLRSGLPSIATAVCDPQGQI
jgi:hypothetical protein